MKKTARYLEYFAINMPKLAILAIMIGVTLVGCVFESFLNDRSRH